MSTVLAPSTQTSTVNLPTVAQHEANSNAAPEPGKKPAAIAHEYLTFRLSKEEYGIDILKVQEIRSYEPPTHIANAPEFLKGVVNLRGTIVPIIDLRVRFNIGINEGSASPVVIVLNVHEHVVGMVVDAVSDVIQLPANAVQPAPEISASLLDTSYIVGLADIHQRLLILVDIEALISSADMGLIKPADES